jgi:hypothetical protein
MAIKEPYFNVVLPQLFLSLWISGMKKLLQYCAQVGAPPLGKVNSILPAPGVFFGSQKIHTDVREMAE